MSYAAANSLVLGSTTFGGATSDRVQTPADTSHNYTTNAFVEVLQLFRATTQTNGRAFWAKNNNSSVARTSMTWTANAGEILVTHVRATTNTTSIFTSVPLNQWLWMYTSCVRALTPVVRVFVCPFGGGGGLQELTLDAVNSVAGSGNSSTADGVITCGNTAANNVAFQGQIASFTYWPTSIFDLQTVNAIIRNIENGDDFGYRRTAAVDWRLTNGRTVDTFGKGLAIATTGTTAGPLVLPIGQANGGFHHRENLDFLDAIAGGGGSDILRAPGFASDLLHNRLLRNPRLAA